MLELLRGFLLRAAKLDQARLRVATAARIPASVLLGLRVERLPRSSHAMRQCAAIPLSMARAAAARCSSAAVWRAAASSACSDSACSRADSSTRRAGKLRASSSMRASSCCLLAGAAHDASRWLRAIRFRATRLFAKRRHGFALRGHTREKLGRLALRLLDFKRDARGARIELRQPVRD